MVEVTLKGILSLLPLELLPRVIQNSTGGAMLAVPLERVLPQLPSGSVQLGFGEIRQAFPALFSHEADLDHTPVSLPLAEVLSRVNPNLLRRRRAQRKVEVPQEIVSPFDKSGRGLSIVKGDTKPPFPDTSAPRFAQPAQPMQLSALPPSRPVLNSAPTPPPPAAAPMPSANLEITPRAALDDTPEPASDTSEFHRYARLKMSEETPITKAASTPAGTVQIALSALAESWPDAVRREIAQNRLVDAVVFFPADVLERALRTGKIAFTWRMMRAWIKPAVSEASQQDSTVVELPLKAVAPAFLAFRRQTVKPVSKVEIDRNIPDLFFGFPQSDSTPAIAKKNSQQDTNFYIWDDKTEVVQETNGKKSGASIGTKFVSKYATPNEIVSRASALDGVAGALIALPDGLAVANQIPPEFNADTLAAFLPQIFGKVSQCTKELRMGELNNLNFTVGNVPWKIFRVNAIFFAAFGRAGEPLPTSHLAALAAELDHKPR